MRPAPDPSVEALLALGDAIDRARGEVAAAIALALHDYGTPVLPLEAEEQESRRGGWADKSLVMRRRPW